MDRETKEDEMRTATRTGRNGVDAIRAHEAENPEDVVISTRPLGNGTLELTLVDRPVRYTHEIELENFEVYEARIELEREAGLR